MDAIVTRNDLKSNAKKESIDLLNARLADAIDLALITKQAHWNVKGPQFIAIHEMLDVQRVDPALNDCPIPPGTPVEALRPYTVPSPWTT